MALYRNRAGRIVEGINPAMFQDHQDLVDKGDLVLVKDVVFEDSNRKSVAVMRPVVAEKKTEQPVVEAPKEATTEGKETLKELQEKYTKKFGKKVFFGWNEQQLREKLQD